MSNETRIGTLNLCLGLRNKKEEVRRMIQDNNIDILCMQEIEIPKDFPIQMLTFKGYQFENENNNIKSRCGMYISNNISYVRRNDLETEGIHAMIIDIKDVNKTRIINVYRSFNPQNNQTQREHFDSLLENLKSNANTKTIILGDFNLDYRKRFDINYSHKNYYLALNESLQDFMQIITFPTWSRTVNNVNRESIIDHVYIQDPTSIFNLAECTPTFGDHKLIKFSISTGKNESKITFKRNWKNYNKEILISELSKVDWNIINDDVQSYWNSFESQLIEIVDRLSPMCEVINNKFKMNPPPSNIKQKLNKRNKLIKKLKHNCNNPQATRQTLKQINKDIKVYFHNQKTKSVRRGILPGNSKSLWNAVKTAKDLNSSPLPDILYANNIEIPQHMQVDAFSSFFYEKVQNIITSTTINDQVYNGNPKIIPVNSFFMTSSDVECCLKSIKTKNCEGFDRIPQRILTDGAQILLNPLTRLFNLIYHEKSIPAQWSVSKIVPIHKKGPSATLRTTGPFQTYVQHQKYLKDSF